MRFATQDPDIETIIRRVNEGDYDLQPDFQRGDVWTPSKRKRLIDSILRGWHIPPLHLVAREGGLSDVLDGQQRLTAIRDFMRGDFQVDGSIDPLDKGIQALHGMRFGELPQEIQKRIKRFTIRIFELTDYSPEEPHELFFRLNQPTNLTEAEKRNAFIGSPRNQVKDLVAFAVARGMDGERIGFSNARMAYDDVLARVLLTLESKSLDLKITAARITERYRRTEPFDSEIIAALSHAIETFLQLPGLHTDPRLVRPNKATIHTWLCLLSQARLGQHAAVPVEDLAEVIQHIEKSRWSRTTTGNLLQDRLFAIFQDRSTARVADVSSVLIRDLITWMLLTSSATKADSQKIQRAAMAASQLKSPDRLDDQLYEFAIASGWGGLGW